MNLYPLLTGWAVRELEQQIKGARLESVRISEARKAVWLTLFDARQTAEKRKLHLFFSFQPGQQLFFFGPILEAKIQPGWENFDSSLGGAFLKTVRRKGSDSVVEITFTHRDTSYGDGFSLRFTLFGKEARMELFGPPNSEKPEKIWPEEISATPLKSGGEVELTLSGAETYLNQHSGVFLEEALQKALRVPVFLVSEFLFRAEVDPKRGFNTLSADEKKKIAGYHPGAV